MKTALVTGGSRGIGRAVTIALARMGYHVLINYVSNETAALETLDAIGGQGELLRFDVSDPEAVRAAIEGWQAAHPDTYIEVLVNNAGIRKDNLMIWMEPDDWQRVVNTNLTSFFHVTKAVLQSMLLHRYGRIVNIASVSGLKGLPGQANYAAAKGGLIAATKALAQEVARKKVTELNVNRSLWWGSGQVHAGDFLMNGGFNPVLLKTFDSGVFYLEAD